MFHCSTFARRAGTLIAAAMLIWAGEASAKPWEGIWAAEIAWCEFADRIGAADPAPVRFSATKIEGLESTCKISRAEPLAIPNAWVFHEKCSGEGEDYANKELVVFDADGRLVRFTPDAHLVVLTRCPTK